jgi:bifunctional DNA primase/polymerase-like protein
MITPESQLHNCPSSDTIVQSPNPFLASALALAKLGFRIHPLEAGKKKPHLKGYPDLATTNEAQLCQWWERWTQANPGIICGRDSGIVILDIDRRDGGDESLADLEARHGELPLTWTVQTLDGFQLYLRHPSDCFIRYGLLAPGIELLAHGRNAVGVGSYRKADADGAEHWYAWQDCQRPSDIPLADIPHWVRLIAYERGLVQTEISPSSQAQTSRASQVESQKQPSRSLEQEGGRKGKAETPFQPTPGVFLLASSSTSLLEMSDVPPKIDKPYIKGLFSDWCVVRRCLEALGLSHVTDTGQKFRCILHREKDPSASIFRAHDGEYRYSDYHAGKHEGADAPPTYSLTSVYYAKHTGLPLTTRLKASSYVTWSLRLLVDAGVLPPYVLKAPKLQGECTFYEQVVYEGFQRLLATKWLYEKAATPFTWDFAATWCGISKAHVAMAMQSLLSKGYIRGTGDFAKNAALFTLGTRSLINRRARRLKSQARRQTPQPTTQTEVLANVQPDIDAMLKDNEAHSAYPETATATLDTHCGVCTVCGAELDTDGFAYFCPSCGWDERGSPVCA